MLLLCICVQHDYDCHLQHWPVLTHAVNELAQSLLSQTACSCAAVETKRKEKENMMPSGVSYREALGGPKLPLAESLL